MPERSAEPNEWDEWRAGGEREASREGPGGSARVGKRAPVVERHGEPGAPEPEVRVCRLRGRFDQEAVPFASKVPHEDRLGFHQRVERVAVGKEVRSLVATVVAGQIVHLLPLDRRGPWTVADEEVGPAHHRVRVRVLHCRPDGRVVGPVCVDQRLRPPGRWEAMLFGKRDDGRTRCANGSRPCRTRGRDRRQPDHLHTGERIDEPRVDVDVSVRRRNDHELDAISYRLSNDAPGRLPDRVERIGRDQQDRELWRGGRARGSRVSHQRDRCGDGERRPVRRRVREPARHDLNARTTRLPR